MTAQSITLVIRLDMDSQLGAYLNGNETLEEHHRSLAILVHMFETSAKSHFHPYLNHGLSEFRALGFSVLPGTYRPRRVLLNLHPQPCFVTPLQVPLSIS